jgi:hypothetical protein
LQTATLTGVATVDATSSATFRTRAPVIDVIRADASEDDDGGVFGPATSAQSVGPTGSSSMRPAAVRM